MRSVLFAVLFFVAPLLGRGAEQVAAIAADSVAAAAQPEGIAFGRHRRVSHRRFSGHQFDAGDVDRGAGDHRVRPLATRNMKEVPGGAQNFWEWMVESLYDFLEGILGADLVKKTFWFFATIFIFIFFTNWFGLDSGRGHDRLGRGHADGFEVTRPLLRGGNADLNMTFAMSSIFMVLWLFWAVQSNGVGGFCCISSGQRGICTGFIKLMMIVIFFGVGCVEVLSIAFRPISLSLRLYGNIFAGESLLEAISNIVQHPPWAKAVFSALLPVPFYFMELLVGLRAGAGVYVIDIGFHGPDLPAR
jgi:F0F1-type ATP synthase membrane subunit a